MFENTREDFLTLRAIFDQTRSLDFAHMSSERYNDLPIALEKFDSNSITNRVSAMRKKRVISASDELEENPNEVCYSCSTQQLQKTYSYRGNNFHARYQCPATVKEVSATSEEITVILQSNKVLALRN